MKEKLIYLVRHAQTEFNDRHLVQGRGIDASLSQLGSKQAKQLCVALPQDFDQIFVSSLKRTAETLAPLERKFVIDSGLDEMDYGDLEGQRVSESLSLLEKWNQGVIETPAPNGESPVNVAVRQQEAIKRVLSYSGEKLLLGCHGRAIRIMLCWSSGRSLVDMPEFSINNTGISLLRWQEGKDHMIIESVNDTSHLPSEWLTM